MLADLVPLMLILFPLAMAGGCLVLREEPRVVLLAGLAALAVETGLALSAPSMAPARWLDLRVSYDTFGRLVLVAVCGAAFVATLSAAVGRHGTYFIATLLLITGCAASVAVTRDPLLAGGVLLLGGLVGGVQLADCPSGDLRPPGPVTDVALRYSTTVVLGGLVLLLGLTILNNPADSNAGDAALRLGFGLLLFGYAVRCGLIPFHIWQADTVEHAPPATAALHAGVLAALALSVLMIALDARPELLVENPAGRRLLLGLGAVAALAGGVLGSLADTRRSPAYLASTNLGLLTIGFGTASVPGVQAAVLGSAAHVLGTGLVALGLTLVSAAAAGRSGHGDRRARWAGTLVLGTGLLLLVGIPPFAGFAPRLLLLAATGQSHWLLAVLTVAGIFLMALTAGRLMADTLRAQPRSGQDLETAPLAGVPSTAVSSGVLLALAVVLVLAAVLAGWGLLPLTAQLEQVVRNLGFIVP